VFCAFDLLWLNGEDLRQLPLLRRKERLRRLIDRNKCTSLMFAQHIEGKGTALFDQVCKWDMEGIICKRKTGEYSATAGWLKVRNPSYTQHENGMICLRHLRSGRIASLQTGAANDNGSA
jgi:bifunctional non-homologous end joining protein LigD